MVNKPSQDGRAIGTNLSHPGVGVSDKGYRATRETALVKVQISGRDIAASAPLFKGVIDLLKQIHSVELSFSFDDLEWVREMVSPDGDIPNISAEEKKVGNDLVISLKLKQ